MSKTLAEEDRRAVLVGQTARALLQESLVEAVEAAGSRYILPHNLICASVNCSTCFVEGRDCTNGLLRMTRSFHRPFLMSLFLLRAL